MTVAVLILSTKFAEAYNLRRFLVSGDRLNEGIPSNLNRLGALFSITNESALGMGHSPSNALLFSFYRISPFKNIYRTRLSKCIHAFVDG